MEYFSNQIITVLIATLLLIVPLLVTSLGGLFSEKSGIINIGLEGMMIFGAFAGALIMPYLIDLGLPWYLVIIIGILISMLAAMILGVLHAFLSIKIGINQIISGTAINMLAPAITFYFINALYNSYDTKPIQFNLKPITLAPGAVISLDNIFVVVLTIIILVITIFIFKKTKFGIHLLAVGENPQAAATAGLNVNHLRFLAVIISAALAGFGGISMVLLIGGKLTISLIAGYGFLALAILIFSGWRPVYCLYGSILFAFFIAIVPSLNIILNNYSSTNDNIANLIGIIRLLLDTGPYIIAIIILTIFSKNSRAPKALGEVYNKERR